MSRKYFIPKLTVQPAPKFLGSPPCPVFHSVSMAVSDFWCRLYIRTVLHLFGTLRVIPIVVQLTTLDVECLGIRTERDVGEDDCQRQKTFIFLHFETCK